MFRSFYSKFFILLLFVFIVFVEFVFRCVPADIFFYFANLFNFIFKSDIE